MKDSKESIENDPENDRKTVSITDTNNVSQILTKDINVTEELELSQELRRVLILYMKLHKNKLIQDYGRSKRYCNSLEYTFFIQSVYFLLAKLEIPMKGNRYNFLQLEAIAKII